MSKSFEEIVESIVTNSSLKKELESLENSEEVYNIFKKEGYEHSKQEFEDEISQWLKKFSNSGILSDEELDKVSGGTSANSKFLASVLGAITGFGVLSAPKTSVFGVANFESCTAHHEPTKQSTPVEKENINTDSSTLMRELTELENAWRNMKEERNDLERRLEKFKLGETRDRRLDLLDIARLDRKFWEQRSCFKNADPDVWGGRFKWGIPGNEITTTEIPDIWGMMWENPVSVNSLDRPRWRAAGLALDKVEICLSACRGKGVLRTGDLKGELESVRSALAIARKDHDDLIKEVNEAECLLESIGTSPGASEANMHAGWGRWRDKDLQEVVTALRTACDGALDDTDKLCAESTKKLGTKWPSRMVMRGGKIRPRDLAYPERVQAVDTAWVALYETVNNLVKAVRAWKYIASACSADPSLNSELIEERDWIQDRIDRLVDEAERAHKTWRAAHRTAKFYLKLRKAWWE